MTRKLHELGKKDGNAFRLAYEFSPCCFYTAPVLINSANFLSNKAMDNTEHPDSLEKSGNLS